MGDKGDDTFVVYSNQAPLRLEGGDDNDLFVVRGFALAQTKTNGGNPVTGADCTPSPTNPDCEIVWINAQDQIAMPKLTTGFSTAAESDIRTGSGQNQVEYNMNAPVSVDGGAGFDKLVILGTEYADHIVVTAKAIYGVGVSVTYTNIEVLEIDALEGDDTIDVLSTATGVATRVIGGLGNDTINVAGDVTGDVFSLDIEGTSSTVNHAVASTDATYNGLPADGVDLSVARAGQGSVVIKESGGFSAVYEGGCLGLSGDCTPVPALDSYTVALAAAPNCGPSVAAGDCKVYVTVSAAYPPQSEHPSLTNPYADGAPSGNDGDTFLVATTHADPGACAVVTTCDFYRKITLNGSMAYVSKRSLVLVFDGNTWSQAQTVYMWAVNDTRAEGTRIVTASHSVIQPLCDSSDLAHCYDGAIVRNVEVTVYDNDQPAVLVTQLDPNTQKADNSSTVLEGWGTAVSGATGHPATEQADLYSIVLATAPSAGTTVVVDLTPSDIAPDPARVCLTSSDPLAHLGLVNRFTASHSYADPTNCASTPGVDTYTVTFDSSNWFVPVLIWIHARNDFAPQDPHTTTILHTISATSTDTAYRTIAPRIQERLDVLVIDDENPGVFVLPSDGSTIVVACGNTECSVPGTSDSYQLRLDSQPKAEVRIAIIGDGQTDVATSSLGPRVALEQWGGLQASQAFAGNIQITGSGSTRTITRVNGSDLGSFLDEGFVKGQRIRLSGTGNGSDGDYVITNLGILTLTVTPATALPTGPAGVPVNGTYAGVLISQLQSKGVYAGNVAYDATANTLILLDHSSWLDHGFLEGQLIKISGFSGPGCVQGFGSTADCLFKIQLISGTDANHTDKITLTSAPAGLTDPLRVEPDRLSGTGTAYLTVVQWAVVAHFSAPDPSNAPDPVTGLPTCPVSPTDTCGTWYQPLTITLVADPFFQLAPGRANLRTFGKQPHLLSGIRGPLAVEGGTTSADRSIRPAVLLPGEDNRPAFSVAAQPPEWQQIDTLNVYGDGSKEDLTGTLTSTALSGLNMGQGLDFSYLLCPAYPSLVGCKHPFSEPGKYPGGISYGSISIDSNGVFTTDGTLSTIEIVNILLGAGNDHLDIASTLQPGGDFNPITGQRGELAHHGGITAVHGGGNALLKVDGTFDLGPAPFGSPSGTVGRITRTDGLMWTRYGFAVGQQITLPDGTSYTITGFATGAYGSGDTLLLGGGAAIAAKTVGGEVAVSDFLAVTGTFTVTTGLSLNGGPANLNGILLTNGQAWQSLGFAVGQKVYVPGAGLRTIMGFANDPSLNVDGTPRDGAILLVNGSLTAGSLSGTVSLATRYRVSGTLKLTGSSTGGTVAFTSGSVAGSGLAVGQQVWITGVGNGPRTITAINGNTITVTDGPIPTPAATAGMVALVRVGGDTIRLTGPSLAGLLTTTPTTITRATTPTSDWIQDGFAVGRQVILGGGLSGTFNVTGVTATTLTVTPVNGSTLGTGATSATITELPVGAGPGQPYDSYAPLVIYGDTSQDGVWYGGDPHTQSLHNFGPKPMPHVEGTTVTLSRSADGWTGYITLGTPTGTTSGDFRTDGFAVGQELALGPATSHAVSAAGIVYDVYASYLERATGSWITDGFQIGQQVTIGALAGPWTVVGVTATILDLRGPTLTPLPNQIGVVTAISQYVGIVKSITKTQIVLNLAIGVADFPNGPLFPVAASLPQTDVVRDIRVLNRVGNSAPFFVFPLANPYLYNGNDVIDAHLLDWTDNPNAAPGTQGALRPIGLTVYGGSGNDTIIGSQTGDQLAGGSGDDTIMGQRGQDHIYGDSGFNVNLITRELVVAVLGNGPAGYPAAKFPDKDLLVAGNDLLYGEGPGSAPSGDGTTIGNNDDIIFGDLGVVTQDVSGAA